MRAINALLVCMTTVVTVVAQPPHLADPAPGQVFLTPQIDLDLGPVPLVVPERYATANLAERELMLPPGFAVNVFAAGEPLEGPRFMAWDPEGVLHVANMKAGGGSEFTPPVNTDRPPAVEQMRGQVLALPDRDGDGVALPLPPSPARPEATWRRRCSRASGLLRILRVPRRPAVEARKYFLSSSKIINFHIFAFQIYSNLKNAVLFRLLFSDLNRLGIIATPTELNKFCFPITTAQCCGRRGFVPNPARDYSVL